VWRRIEDPRELESLGPDELYARVRPLLRRLAGTRERLARVRDNIPSACAELAREWKRSPRLRGREVGFGEYLAAHLCAKLHELDQAQHPHLYDEHRKYRPERETLPLYEKRDGDERPLAGAPVVPDLSQAREQELDPPEQLQLALTAAGIAPASQPGVFALAAGFQSGSISSPYLTARAQGYSSFEARNHPATAVYLALEALPGATGWRYS
jgi:hypothetical protein